MASQIAERNGYDGNAQSVVGAKADLIAGHANNAGIPRPEHLNADSAPQTEFF
jgi:hypothetical protein